MPRAVRRGALVIFLSTIFLSTIGCRQHVPAPGEAIADVCRIDRDGQTVTASGYVQAPMLIGCQAPMNDCMLQLTPARKGAYGLSLRVPLGTGPSTMTPLPPTREPPSSGGLGVERVSIDLRDASGKSVAIRSVVRASGVLHAYESGGQLRCEVRVSRLEAL